MYWQKYVAQSIWTRQNTPISRNIWFPFFHKNYMYTEHIMFVILGFPFLTSCKICSHSHTIIDFHKNYAQQSCLCHSTLSFILNMSWLCLICFSSHTNTRVHAMLVNYLVSSSCIIYHHSNQCVRHSRKYSLTIFPPTYWYLFLVLELSFPWTELKNKIKEYI